jgi:hypothetical protein
MNPLEVVFIGWGIIGFAMWPISAGLPREKAPLLWWIVLPSAGLVVVAVVTIRLLVTRRTYYVIVLTWEDEYAAAMLDKAERFFRALYIPKAGPRPLLKIADVDKVDWQGTLARAIEQIREATTTGEVHLACNAYWMWCFAIGTRLQDRHALVLYHHEKGEYHRIWKMSREIKNRKSIPYADYHADVCVLREVRRGTRSDAVVLVVMCGSHFPVDAVQLYVNGKATLAEAPFFTIGFEGGLDPHQPARWVDAAADLAISVDHLTGNGTKELYLFGVMPDVLGLMTGSTVGPYRRIHLMQYHQGSYFEALELAPKP